MAIDTTVKYAEIDDLFLDPKNPRLGRHNVQKNLSQEQILELMRTWTLEELAESYLENQGFWTHEALIVIKESLYSDSEPKLVVVEGNRRLAALIYLHRAIKGESSHRKWRSIASSAQIPDDLFTKVPYLLAESRSDVQSFLGFRHVTGIKEWDADEKAAFIATLIEEENLSYEQVMRKIGSKTPTVRDLYIAYRVLIQIEENVEDYEPLLAENRFAILYMTLKTEGAKKYLQIDMMAEPNEARYPIPQEHLENLANFSRWLFGTQDIQPIVTDTRMVNDFGKILNSNEAIQYLERTTTPKFEVALRIAGGDEEEIIRLIQQAADNIELALSRAHFFKDSSELKKEVRRVGINALQIMNVFFTALRDQIDNLIGEIK